MRVFGYSRVESRLQRPLNRFRDRELVPSPRVELAGARGKKCTLDILSCWVMMCIMDYIEAQVSS